MKTITFENWQAEGEKRFGIFKRHWRFVCPKCGTVQGGQDFKRAGIDEDSIKKVIGFSCIGRYAEGVGCDWSLGGLFQIHKLEVVLPSGKNQPVFEFALKADNP